MALPSAVAHADYTIGHRGHQLRIGPIAFWIAVGTLVIMAGWTIVTATYFAFHDDVLARLIMRRAQMQFAYEDRIADMRAQVDRITSRQLLDQEQVERKLDLLLRRQETLESRAAKLREVIAPAATGSIGGAGRRSGASARTAPPKPSPIRGTIDVSAPAERKAEAGSIAGTLPRLEASLDRVEQSQAAALDAIREHYDRRIHRVRSVLASLGIDPGRLRSSDESMGGPFIPVSPHESTFEGRLSRLEVARAQAQWLRRALNSVPLRHPLTGDLDVTSGFGVRIDPFLGVPAMHTGEDFRASTGDPVHVTAAGVVTIAGWTGGYGNLVEVRHVDGITTRYGHLSKILVHVGEKVTLGQIVGRVGSTGRATGPHLHYETRIGGDAVDPQRFLRAGTRLRTALLGSD